MFNLFNLNLGIVFAIVTAIIAGAFIYMVIITERQRKAKQTLERSLEKLKKAYNELDEQAKIIVKKDLELNKAQEELDKKLNSLYTLHKLSKALSSTFDTEKLFSQINKSFISELGFDKGLIALVNPDTKKLSLTVAVGYTSLEQEKIKKHLSEKNILEKIDQPLLLDRNFLSKEGKKNCCKRSTFPLSVLCRLSLRRQDLASL
jgi:hypothetical protein